MNLDHQSCELMLLHYVHEFGHETFTFSVADAQKIPNFLSGLKSLILDGLIVEEKPDEFGFVFYRVSEEGHQKVAEFMEALEVECLPLLEDSFRKHNQ